MVVIVTLEVVKYKTKQEYPTRALLDNKISRLMAKLCTQCNKIS